MLFVVCLFVCLLKICVIHLRTVKLVVDILVEESHAFWHYKSDKTKILRRILAFFFNCSSLRAEKEAILYL